MNLHPNLHHLLQSFAFVVGCCLGSFFNVIIHRLPGKGSIVHPGSHCPRCGHPIAFYDNIPLLSFLVLGGRCRHCRERISLRYPLVEVLTGVLTLVLFRTYGPLPQFFIETLFVYLLILIAFIDLDTYLIPDVLSLSGIVAGLALSFFTPRLSWVDSLLGILLGGGFLYLIAVGYQVLRHKEGMGGGDIKLLAMIGAFVGLPGVVFTVLAASVVGTAAGVWVMVRSRQGLSAMLPFGPFLSLGAVCHLFWGQTFFSWYLERFTGG
ncbi:MAG TPA: prepilin peptidase [Syntrophobacteraceae bacterium]|mgnify:CR=1 FL=1|nr:prepilin peptidase [Syntrophobacteraceae bacterium]